ncbi:hypothetical protein PMAYCL1PPCAC_17508 [Pristionchus mayeri]|uniref:C6 domain-containing protein n=1 Tax=Pristionchus mayeri TaxID=1317129 RepID=A0AAN5CMS6_9BILA|nr:hypothetical protein PMAYCL1PPCAC_17508 [Pristionchus mayeri]
MMAFPPRSLVLLLVFLLSCDACMRVTPGTPGMPAVPCKTCSQTLIMKTINGAGAKEFMSDTTVTTGACAVRTLVCTGNMANVEINGDDGTIDDGGTGTVNFEVTCNTAGTAWQFMGIDITQLECASGA